MPEEKTGVESEQGEEQAIDVAETPPKQEALPGEVEAAGIDWSSEGPKLMLQIAEERQARRKTEDELHATKKGRIMQEERDERQEATRRLAEESRDYARATLASRKKELEAAKDEEGLAELSKQENEIVARRGQQTLDQQHRVALRKIEAIGNQLGMDVKAMNADPTFEEARGLFASQRYHEALVAAYEARDAIMEAKQRQAKAKEGLVPTPASNPPRKPPATDIGPGAGGAGSVTADNIDQKFLDGKVSSEVYRRFIETGEL